MNKKPSKLKLIEGNPGKRPIPKNEVKPHPREPVKSKRGLTRKEKYVWRELAPPLLRLGLLCETDGENFANVVRIVARIREIDKIMADPETKLLISYTESTPSGTEKPVVKLNPLLPEQRHLMKDLRLYAPEFGMTPRGRANLVVGDPGSDKPEMEGLID